MVGTGATRGGGCCRWQRRAGVWLFGLLENGENAAVELVAADASAAGEHSLIEFFDLGVEMSVMQPSALC